MDKIADYLSTLCIPDYEYLYYINGIRHNYK